MRACDVGGVFASGRQGNSGEGPPQLEFDDFRAAPSDPRATFASAREWQQWVDSGPSRRRDRTARSRNCLRRRTWLVLSVTPASQKVIHM